VRKIQVISALDDSSGAGKRSRSSDRTATGMSIITLTTDFGTRDEYVGAMKGVILKIDPGATLVDITHHVPAQAARSAGETLKAAFAWFPEGTVHLAVVDPGVGSDRAILAARYAGHIFIAPDNGLLPLIWNGRQPQALVLVQNNRFFLHPVSHTFHGRDIFAPVAAHLASGVDLNELGPAVNPDQIRQPALDPPEWKGDTELVGRVMGADHFGNLRTNIDREHIDRLAVLCENRKLKFTLSGHDIFGLSITYGSGTQGRLIALINSRNQLEIAVVGGSAADRVKAIDGAPVRVYCS
jgi:S-adenosylmethionine hydrolase